MDLIMDEYFSEIFKVLKIQPEKFILFELYPLLFEYIEVEKRTQAYWEELKELTNRGGVLYKMSAFFGLGKILERICKRNLALLTGLNVNEDHFEAPGYLINEGVGSRKGSLKDGFGELFGGGGDGNETAGEKRSASFRKKREFPKGKFFQEIIWVLRH